MLTRAKFATIEQHTFYCPALGSRPKVLDLGANHGRFARQMGDTFNADVRMVEPNPELFAELSAEATFPVYYCAVTDEDGPISFNVSHNDAGSSILTLPVESEYNCVLLKTVNVPGRTITSLIDEIGWDYIDLIKMDIEGAEVRALDAMTSDVLARVAQITIEFHCDPIFQFNMKREVEQCLKRMRDRGFLIIDFTFPARIDVLLINANLVKIPFPKRLWWSLMYTPPQSFDRLLRKIIPVSFRAMLGRWRKQLLQVSESTDR